LVAFQTPEEVQVDITGVVNGGKHLKPRQVNELVEKRGDDVAFLMAGTILRLKSVDSKTQLFRTSRPHMILLRRSNQVSMTT